eukprot:12396360-Karenia_brevis.AAC.1
MCALALATSTQYFLRWIPTEYNVADGPSRLRPKWVRPSASLFTEPRLDTYTGIDAAATNNLKDKADGCEHARCGNTTTGAGISGEKTQCSEE